jgi:predicted nucleic acid-binding protein
LKDSWHEKSFDFISKFKGRLIVPSTIIPEACYLLNNYLGKSAELAFINSLINRELAIEHFAMDDLVLCVELLKKYDYLNLGLVDASVAVVAERLKVRKILTTDRRHFAAVKPRHCEAFTLLP